MTADNLARRSLVEAALCAVTAEALLTFMDALIKGLSARYPTLQIAFLRFAFGTVWATVLIALFWPGWPSAETIRTNISRSFLVVITATCFFFALGRLPLAETVALSFVSPLLMVLFGGLILGEKLDRSIFIALGAGLAGMLLIVGWRLGHTAYEAEALLGVAAICISTITYALNIIVLRVRAQRDPAMTIVWFQSSCPAVMLLIPALFVWTPPTSRCSRWLAGWQSAAITCSHVRSREQKLPGWHPCITHRWSGASSSDTCCLPKSPQRSPSPAQH